MGYKFSSQHTQQTLSFLSPAAREEKKSVVEGERAGLLSLIWRVMAGDQPSAATEFHSTQLHQASFHFISFGSILFLPRRRNQPILSFIN